MRAEPFALLGTAIGEGTPGGVQFAPRERVATLLDRAGEVEWLDDAQVAARLDELVRDQTAWLPRSTTGQFTLAGAQAKTALVRVGGRWGLPTGSTPSTHILKPAVRGLDDHDLNEHLCMAAARAACRGRSATRQLRRSGSQVPDKQ